MLTKAEEYHKKKLENDLRDRARAPASGDLNYRALGAAEIAASCKKERAFRR